jgi:hypothetical protein
MLTVYVSDQYGARASARTTAAVTPPPPAVYAQILLNASAGLDAALATSDPSTVFQILKSVAAVASYVSARRGKGSLSPFTEGCLTSSALL